MQGNLAALCIARNHKLAGSLVIGTINHWPRSFIIRTKMVSIEKPTRALTSFEQKPDIESSTRKIILWLESPGKSNFKYCLSAFPDNHRISPSFNLLSHSYTIYYIAMGDYIIKALNLAFLSLVKDFLRWGRLVPKLVPM